MPSKSRRAASRQAEVRRRRRRGRGAHETFDTGPTEAQRAARLAEEEPSGQQRPAPASPVGAAVARPARRVRTADREEAPSYGYLGAELRRIGILTTLIAALLIGATFALGG